MCIELGISEYGPHMPEHISRKKHTGFGTSDEICIGVRLNGQN